MVPPKGIRHFQWLFCFSFVLLSVSLVRAGNPDVIKASRHDVSPPLSQMAVGASFNGGGSTVR
jgi:hypothetical protein